MVGVILAFIILLGILILAHEWGHFVMARVFGVRVEEFAFGFPPRLWSATKRGTRYAINLLPLGGYVKIYGEAGEDSGDRESFSSRALHQRFLILAAGVAMNFFLAWVLFSIVSALGLPTVLEENDARAQNAAVTIVAVFPDSPAARADLRPDDVIIELRSGSQTLIVKTIAAVQGFVQDHRGQEIRLLIRRGGENVDIRATPRMAPPSGEGPLGIGMAFVATLRTPLLRAPLEGLAHTGEAAAAIIRAIYRIFSDLFQTGRLNAELSGPVGIFVFAQRSLSLGIVPFLELGAVLSVNLALLNILPIPALDGGRILFLFFEKIKGGRISPKLEQAVHTIGFALLLALMALITYRDIVRVL